MKTLILTEGTSGTAVAAQTAVGCTATPFLPGRNVVCHVNSNGLTGTPTILVQGSDDNSTWTTLATHTSLYNKQYNIQLRRYMRTNMTVVGTAGTFSAYCTNGA